MVLSRRYVLVLVLLMGLFSPLRAFGGSLPKDGRVAVVMIGSGVLGRADVAGAASAIIRELSERGYPVVDKNRLDAMERSEAARLALDGDVDAIMALGKKFGVWYYVKAVADGHKPVVNEFGLYTATVTISIQAYRASDGRYLFADSSVGKEVGYTSQESASKALLAAASSVAVALGEGESTSKPRAKSTGKTFSLSVSGLSGLVGAESFRKDLQAMEGIESASLKSGLGKASLEVVFQGTVDQLASQLEKAFKGLVVEDRTPGSLSLRFQ